MSATPGQHSPGHLTRGYDAAVDTSLVGVIVPFDMALDRELWRWTPDNVSLLLTRTPYALLPVTVEMAQVVGDLGVVEQSTRNLRVVRPAVYAYGCTSGSFVNGVAGERRMVEAMRAAGDAEAVTTSGALVQALSYLGVDKIAMATPYDCQVTARLSSFLREAGVDVVGSAHLGLTGEIWKVSNETTADLIRRADCAQAEAIVVSCTNLATYDVIGALEYELDKPVITANQVTMWAALRLIGRRGVGPGQRLFTLEPGEFAGSTPVRTLVEALGEELSQMPGTPWEPCPIWVRQLKPSATIAVDGSARRTAGSRTRSPAACDTS
jgi:maleate isomerase